MEKFAAFGWNELFLSFECCLSSNSSTVRQNIKLNIPMDCNNIRTGRRRWR